MNESGVIIYFSFLLFDKKFITVLTERYTDIIIQITFVVLDENQSGIIPPVCKTMITKNICKRSCATSIAFNFLGKTLCCPPIVSSPNGSPQIISTVIIITTEKEQAPIIDDIFFPPIVSYLRFIIIKQLVFNNNIIK